MNRRPRYKAQEPTVTASDLLDATDGSTRRFIGQGGQVEERPTTRSGFVVGSGPNGQPSYQFSTAAGAPLAEGTGVMSNQQWADRFKGYSPLGVEAGYKAGSQELQAPDAPNNIVPFPSGQSGSESTGTPAGAPTIDDVIAQGEAYHKANGLPLPSITNNPNQTLYPDAGGSGATFGNPAGDAAQTVLKYGEPGESAFTQYGGSPPPSGGITNTTFAGTVGPNRPKYDDSQDDY